MITENIKYTNHLGEVFCFGSTTAWIDENDLHDYEWDYSKSGSRVHSLKRSKKSRSLPCRLYGRTEKEALALKNKLTDLTEKDILAEKMGRLSVGEWYIPCYVYGSSKSNYLLTEKYIENKLDIISPIAGWLRARQYTFYSATEDKGGFDYPFDYSFDYEKSFLNALYVDRSSDFKIVFNGIADSMDLLIGSQRYSVDYPIGYGERIEIDSIDKTVIHYDIYGNPTNVFGYRNRNNYIFERIPQGNHVVSWSGANTISMTILIERSEPEWI